MPLAMAGTGSNFARFLTYSFLRCSCTSPNSTRLLLWQTRVVMRSMTGGVEALAELIAQTAMSLASWESEGSSIIILPMRA